MSSYRDGARAALPLLLPTIAIGASFGVLAESLDWGIALPLAMSALLFAGSAQFTLAAVLGSGGGLAAAVVAASLVNLRFLPMGIAAGPALRGGPARRALEGQAVVDASWALAAEEGRFDRELLLGATAPQYLCWFLGTLIGVLFAGQIGDPEALGLDALFPAFFLGLLAGEVRTRTGFGVAVAGALIAVALISFTPAGIPVVAATIAAFWGLKHR